MPIIEIQRRDGQWERAALVSRDTPSLYRYAAAVAAWIGNPNGDVAAVRIQHGRPLV